MSLSEFPPLSSRGMPEDLDPGQVRVLRGLTPAQRLETAFGLLRTARDVKAAALRAEHPEWAEDAIRREVARVFLRART